MPQRTRLFHWSSYVPDYFTGVAMCTDYVPDYFTGVENTGVQTISLE
jgi:hypothetical protein